ncbi:small acid-soluble spore protein P [Paenibacillus sp. HW567]|uniref:small acid-soluble spore protein P n=1 Tax=Paenibacillus sp. HW567 TaxID=1034769 RepID=UPI00035F3AB6|nr:small acid-soluble spore protein P [Paenibacillus sp. HW567]
MSKPKSVPVPGTGETRQSRRNDHKSSGPEPLSGSKKVKQANHVDHHNPQG